MKIAVVGTGYVGLVPGACLAENGNDVVCVDKDEAKIRLLKRGQDADLRARARRAGPPQHEREAADLHHRSRPRRSAGADRLHRRRHAEGEDGSADLQHVLGVAREIGRAMNSYTVVVDKSTVPVGTADEGARRHSPRDDAAVQRRQQPRVPEAGRGDRGLHEAGPRGHRRRRPAVGRADEGAVRAVHAHRRADHDDGYAERRAVQVRRERDARDAHLVHERDRERLRAGRRRRRPGAQGDRRRTGGSARRSCFPASATAAAAFPKDVKALLQFAERQGLRLQDPARGRGGQRARRRRGWSTKMEAHFGVAARASASRSGGWRSSRRPTTCARRRRSPIIERPARARRDGAGLRSGGDDGRRAASSAIADPLCEKSYDALTGADALAIVTEWNEFREPDFEKMRKLMRSAGRLRRPQHLLPEQHARARLHLLLHWPLMRARARDRRRRLHRQPRRQGAAARAATRRRLRQPQSAGIARRVQLRRARRGRHPRRGGGARRAASRTTSTP